MRTRTIGSYGWRWLGPWAVLSALTLSGCARTPVTPESSVSGSVTYDGAPVREGRLTFLGADGKVATTTLQHDGTYRMMRPPTGRVRVGVVRYPKVIGFARKAPTQPSRAGQAVSVVPPQPVIALPPRYADADQSDLVIEIEPGQSQLDIAVPFQAGDPPAVRDADIPREGLDVGQLVPDIAGEDLEGQPFQLSEHRGKVVAILFWAHW